MNELHSGHIWVNASCTLLPEFVQHYLQCKQAAPSTTACIVPGFLLPVMRPFLKGMHILTLTVKDLHYLMHLLHLANVVQWLGLTGLYTCSLTGCYACRHTTCCWSTVPPFAQRSCASAVPSVPVAVSKQPLTMLFEGHLEQEDALTLLDSGASANFISKKALDIGKLTFNPTEATLELADGISSSVIGTAQVTLCIGAFCMRVSCFVTELSIDFDIVLGNSF